MVNMYKTKLTGLQQEILRLFFIKAGAQLNQRQIANLLDVSAPAVLKAMPTLEKENLVKLKQNKEKRWEIELNRDSQRVLALKRADNLKLIYESGLADYLEKEFAGATIILFGSYSRGEDLINSDIDIAIVGRKDKKINIADYEKKLEREININFYSSFKDISKELKENIFNGIVLFGGIEI